MRRKYVRFSIWLVRVCSSRAGSLLGFLEVPGIKDGLVFLLLDIAEALSPESHWGPGEGFGVLGQPFEIPLNGQDRCVSLQSPQVFPQGLKQLPGTFHKTL